MNIICLCIFLLIIMVNHRKVTKEADEKIPAMTAYVPQSLKKAEQRVAQHLGVSLSERIRTLMEKDVAEFEGDNFQELFDLDAKYSERDKWKSTEDKMLKNLENTKSTTRLPTFKVLCQFVTQFGADKQLTEGLDAALSKLWLYKYKGNEPFAESTLFDFIRYLEAVMNRRRVESEIWGYKQKQQQDPLEACHV